MGLMLIIFYTAYKYIETIIKEEIGKNIKHYQFTIIPLIITILGVIFLPLSYIESKRSNYSYGPAAFMTYLGVAIYLFMIIRLMVQYGKLLPTKKKKAIYIALLSEIPVAVYQIIPDSLITCIGMVLLNLGIYMTTENPDALLAEQLEKEKKRADTANEAKTNFLANMSHEIRTPITAVLGMNELILRESKETSIKQYAKDIEGAAKSLLSIINDILDISKIEKGKLSVISAEYDFRALLRDVTNMISFKARVKDITFQTLIDENIPKSLMGDDIRIRQILVNLLNNAVKYTPNGIVTLEIALLPSESTNIARLYFNIKDTGIGIIEEDLQKLCVPFERIEEKRNRNIEGTGLGMSITKQLLSLLHSELKVHSVYGEGSEFSFELQQEIVDSTPIGTLDQYTYSANAIVGAKKRYMEEGFTAFLEKPIDCYKLEALIKELLNSSLLRETTTPIDTMHTTTFEFPVIEGLDWNYARIHFHDEETMLDTVTFFVESIDYDALELDTLFTAIGTDDGNRNYCTKVHSLKNSAATISSRKRSKNL